MASVGGELGDTCRAIKPSRLGFWGAGVFKGPNWQEGVNSLI
jgi:hypothetical protein